jgi:4-hydroxy-tetrahydrodipicolinate synthase
VYQGVIVPLVTPLTPQGAVCAASVERLIESVRPAAAGLIPTLSSGEGWAVSLEQWQDMVVLTRRFARGLPVLAGIELPTTGEVIERARLARQLEVEAIVIPPLFGRDRGQDELLAHYRAVAEGSGLPLFLYNEPKLAGTALSLQTLVELCRSGKVVGVKDSSGSVDVTMGLVSARTGVPVFQGWEHLCLATTPGVQGYILPLSNLEAGLCRSMFEAPSAEKQEEIARHCTAHDLLGERWYAGLKRELKRRGVIESERLV